MPTEIAFGFIYVRSSACASLCYDWLHIIQAEITYVAVNLRMILSCWHLYIPSTYVCYVGGTCGPPCCCAASIHAYVSWLADATTYALYYVAAFDELTNDLRNNACIQPALASNSSTHNNIPALGFLRALDASPFALAIYIICCTHQL